MENLSVKDIEFILESLEYTRLKFENYPIGEKGYPSYEYKQQRIQEVTEVIAKVKKIKSNLK